MEIGGLRAVAGGENSAIRLMSSTEINVADKVVFVIFTAFKKVFFDNFFIFCLNGSQENLRITLEKKTQNQKTAINLDKAET